MIPTCNKVRTTVRKDADTTQELKGHLRHHISAAGVTKAKKKKEVQLLWSIVYKYKEDHHIF